MANLPFPLVVSKGSCRSLLTMAFQDFLETLASPEKDAVEMEAVEAEVGADGSLLFLGHVETQEELPVAVGGELADEPPHGLGLLVLEDAGERARRGVDRLGQLLVVRVGPAAGGLAPLGDDQVARGAAQESRKPGRLVESPLPQALQGDAEGLLMEVLRQL